MTAATAWSPEHLYWSFVQSASSQAQLTATLAGISITAMVLVMSPLFLGARASELGADRQSEIRDLFKFLLIAFTCLVTASMLWGQLNGFSVIEASSWVDCQRGKCLNAVVAPIHILFLSCASLMTLGVVALVVALLELVLLSSTQPAQLSKLVLATYAVTVSFASLQVMFGAALAEADLAGSPIGDKEATDRAMLVVPIVVVLGLAPAIRSWARSRRDVGIPQQSELLGQRSKPRAAETWALWTAGGLSAFAVQMAPELAVNADDFGPFAPGGVLAIIGAIVAMGYACLIWWSLWNVIDRLSIPGRTTADGASAALPVMPTESLTRVSKSFEREPDPGLASNSELDGVAFRGKVGKSPARVSGRVVLQSRRKPHRGRNRRHAGTGYGRRHRGTAEVVAPARLDAGHD